MWLILVVCSVLILIVVQCVAKISGKQPPIVELISNICGFVGIVATFGAFISISIQ